MSQRSEISVDQTHGDPNTTILHIGTVNLASANVTSDRRREFRDAFQEAIAKALEREVEVVVQTGQLWAARNPPDADVRLLRSELEKLQSADIRFVHAGSDRDIDMEIVDDLIADDLIERPYDEPAIVGSTAILSIPPEETNRQFDNIQSLAEVNAERKIVAGVFTAQEGGTHSAQYSKEGLPEAIQTEVDVLLLGNDDIRSTILPDKPTSPVIYISGPTELEWRPSKNNPYPCTVGLLSDNEYELLEIDRDDCVIYHVSCTADTTLEDLTAELEPDGRTTYVRLKGHYDDTSVSEDELQEWLDPRSDITAIKDKRSYADRTPSSEKTTELKVTTKYSHTENPKNTYSQMIPDDLSEIDEVETYVCGQNEGADESTCQECFTRELFGLPGNQNDRDTQPGDLLLLYDYGNKNIRGSDDKYVYGPFRAESEVETDIVAEAWDGEFPNQVEVTWGQLYRLPQDDAPVNMWDDFVIQGQDARDLIEALTEKGTKVRVVDNGNPEPIDELDEGEDEGGTEEPPDDPVDPVDTNGIRDIMELREMAEPLPRQDFVANEPNPGAALIRSATSGEDRPSIYEEALVHLIAGKNVVFYGPPGSGKTRIAERLSEALCSHLHVATANAEWTNQDVVGGYKPESDGFTASPGVLTEAARGCKQSLSEIETPHPVWLLIDELNRANLDEAFGEVLTLLDLSYRTNTELSYADDKNQAVPLSFRVLGTMNSEDQAQLFALGYAFRRRFAFIEVPPLYDQPSFDRNPTATAADVNLDTDMERIEETLERATASAFEFDEDRILENDSPLAIPYLEEIFDWEENPSKSARDTFDDLRSELTLGETDVSFDKAIRAFVQRLDSEGITQIGQGILIDVYKFVLIRHILFPESTEWKAVDNAVAAYILPQIESFTTELRRAGTVAGESDAVETFEEITEFADSLGFARTADRLREAQESHEILG